MGNYVMWDNLRGNADIERLKHLKRERNASDDD
jgi:hypothetical protein